MNPRSTRALRIGAWHVERDTGLLSAPDGSQQRLEPKSMDLLWLLAERAGEVVLREDIMAALWPGVIVGDDALARSVSKLRQALGDDARQPRYIETIAKRGYRLLAEVVAEVAAEAAAATPAAVGRQPVAAPGDGRRAAPPVPGVAAWALATALALLLLAGPVLQWANPPDPPPPSTPAVPAAADEIPSRLLARADDAYFQFSRADNEAAIELYQRVLALRPDDPGALSGMANALAQRSLRWPPPETGVDTEFTRLRDALASGHLSHPHVARQLQRARRFAERAVALAPESAPAHKALGLVASAQGEFDLALASHRRAVALDPDAWGALINLADILEITGRDADALPYYERAYAAMGRRYDRDPAQVRPWQARLGVIVAQRHQAAGRPAVAEGWYRKVLALSPLDREATRGLAALLREGGAAAEAEQLCAQLAQRLGPGEGCETPPATVPARGPTR